MLASLFVNHGQTKLHVDQPIIVNLSLFLGFTLLTLITCRKTKENKPLSILQTSQMKGLAIILVIIHHLAAYTIDNPNDLSIFEDKGYVGVAMFLIMSGFGLSISLEKKGIKNFFTKRVVRIFIPLIFFKLLSIFLNYVVLEENKDYARIPLEFLKLNGSEWFIPFILFWYCITYVAYLLKLSSLEKVLFYSSVSILFFIIPVPGLWAVHAFSYPLGCWLGLNSKFIVEKINTLINKNTAILMSIIIGGLLLSSVPKTQYLLLSIAVVTCLFFGIKRNIKLNSFVESICLCSTLAIICFNYLNLGADYKTAVTGISKIGGGIAYSLSGIFLAVILCLLISLLVKFKKYSIFLNFVGEISFELYLIHGTFMYALDFVLFRGSLAITFFAYFIIICIAGIVLQKLSSITSDALLRKLSAG